MVIISYWWFISWWCFSNPIKRMAFLGDPIIMVVLHDGHIIMKISIIITVLCCDHIIVKVSIMIRVLHSDRIIMMVLHVYYIIMMVLHGGYIIMRILYGNHTECSKKWIHKIEVILQNVLPPKGTKSHRPMISMN